MKSKLLHEEKGQRTFAVVFDRGDDILKEFSALARNENISAAHFTAVGAFSRVVLGYFDRAKKDYKKIEIDEQVEVLMLAGDIARKDGEVKIHAHVIVGKPDGTAHGGHLLEAAVFPTLELILTESPASLRRRMDDETGLALIDLDAA